MLISEANKSGGDIQESMESVAKHVQEIQYLENKRRATLRPFIGVMYISFADRKSTRLNSSHLVISYAVFCLKKKTARFCVCRRTRGSTSLTSGRLSSHRVPRRYKAPVRPSSVADSLPAGVPPLCELTRAAHA